MLELKTELKQRTKDEKRGEHRFNRISPSSIMSHSFQPFNLSSFISPKPDQSRFSLGISPVSESTNLFSSPLFFMQNRTEPSPNFQIQILSVSLKCTATASSRSRDGY